MPAVIDWTGAVSEAWDNGQNWQGGQVPGAMDTARLGAGSLNNAVINAASTVGGLELQAGFGRSLIINQGASLTSSMTTMAGGTVDGAGSLLATGIFSWEAGEMKGSGTTWIDMLGFLQITGPGVKRLGGTRDVLNGGGALWDGGDIEFLTADNSITNTGHFTVSAFEDVSIVNNAPNLVGRFDNYGTFTAFGMDTTTIGVRFNNFNSGEVVAQGGTLRLAGGGDHRGYYSVNTGTVIDFADGYHLLYCDAELAGTGIYRLSGGRVELPAGQEVHATNVHLVEGGLLERAGSLIVDHFTWTGGRMEGIVDPNTGDVSPGGSTVVTAMGSLTITSNEELTLDGRMLVVEGLANWSGTANIRVEHEGTIVVDGGSFIILDDLRIENTAQDGKFILRNGGQLSKGMDHPGPAIIDLPVENDGGAITLLSALRLDGGLKQTAGSVSVQANSLIAHGIEQSGGTITVASTASISSSLQVAVLGGTFTLNGGQLSVTGGGQLRVRIAGGVFSLVDGQIEAPGAGQIHLEGGGTLEGTGSITGAFYSAGTLNVKMGTLRVTGGSTSPEGDFVQSGGEVKVEMGATFDIPDRYRLCGGTLNLSHGVVKAGTGVILSSITGFPPSAREVTGYGTIQGNLTSYSGKIVVGGTGTTGTITVTGNLTNYLDSDLYFDLKGDNDYDRLEVQGGVTIGGGKLYIAPVEYNPAQGRSFSLITDTVPGDPGSFDSVLWSTLVDPPIVHYLDDVIKVFAP